MKYYHKIQAELMKIRIKENERVGSNRLVDCFYEGADYIEVSLEGHMVVRIPKSMMILDKQILTKVDQSFIDEDMETINCSDTLTIKETIKGGKKYKLHVFQKENGDAVYINECYLKIMGNENYTYASGKEKFSPLMFYKDDEPVAIILPVNMPGN